MMKISTQFAMIRKAAALVAISAAVLMTACSKEKEGGGKPEPSSYPALDEIIGSWEAMGYRWDLEDTKTLFYLMDDGNYAVDENGDYIIMTVKEYCEQFAKDYNADPANDYECTAEDVATVPYEGSLAFTDIDVTGNKIELHYGNRGIMSACSITGTYTYDQQTGIMTVENLAIESEPATLKINIWKDAEGDMCFRYWDMGPFGHNSYDETKKYTIWGTYTFVCVPRTDIAQ